jgi:hypothetical protein
MDCHFAASFKPGLAVLVAQRAFGLRAAFLGLFRKCSTRRFGTL